MKRLTVSLCALAFSLGAWADDSKNNGSEFLHQAPAGALELTPGLSYDSGTVNVASGLAPLTSSTSSGYLASGILEYGFNDYISAGLELDFSATWANATPSSAQPDTRSMGLNDPTLFVKGQLKDLGPGTLKLGTDLHVAIAKSYTDPSLNTNTATGAVSLQPFVGYEMYFDRHTVGAVMKYQFYLTKPAGSNADQLGGPDATYTTGGGETFDLSAFYEYQTAPVTVGAALTWHSAADTTQTFNNGDIISNGGNGYVDLRVYVPIDVTPTIRLLPSVDYQTFTAMDTTIYSSVNFWMVNFAARFAL